MNFTKFFDFVESNLNESQIQGGKGNALIANSLRPIIEEVFMAKATSFTIVISSRQKNVYNLFMSVMQYLFYMIPFMNIQLVCVDHRNPRHIEGKRHYNLFLIDSFESFLDIDAIHYSAKYDINEYYHIFLLQFDSETDNDMQRIFQYCWHNQIINSNIEFQNAQGELHMFTYFPFGPHSCNNTEPRHINQYVEGKWLRKPYYLPKVNNLFGCPLVGAVRDISFFSKEVDVNGTLRFKGYEIDVLHEIADFMNFSVILKKSLVDDRLRPESGGGINMLEERVAHIVLGYYRKRISTDFSEKYTTTMPHYQSVVVMTLNYSAHKLKALQVLTFPFCVYTWIAVAVCFAMTFMIAKLSHLRNPQAISAFSIVATTLGIPIPISPKRLDSICIFTPWLWMTFVMRAMYAGILYHIFSNNIYQRMPVTLNQAISDSYRSVMNPYTLKDVKGIPYYNSSESDQNTIILPFSNELESLDYLLHSDEQKVFGVVAQEFIMAYIRANKAGGRFYVIPENFITQQVCFYLAKHSFLINRFDTSILKLKAAGLVKFLMKRHTFKISAMANKQQDKMIHYKDLYGIYLTCCCLYFLALGVFCLEQLSTKFLWLNKLFVYLE